MSTDSASEATHKRPRIGESVERDGVELRCYDVCGRCSHWIAADATMRRRYEDTGHWTDPLLPDCNQTTGGLLANTGQRIERALHNAWIAQPVRHACLKDARQGLHADNLQTDASTTERPPRVPRPRRPSACIVRALEAAARSDSLEDVARHCSVSKETAINYVAKGVALVGCTAGVAHLVDASLLRALERLPCVSGALRDLVPLVHEQMSDAEWERIEFPYNKLRIGRAYEEQRRLQQGVTFSARVASYE